MMERLYRLPGWVYFPLAVAACLAILFVALVVATVLLASFLWAAISIARAILELVGVPA